jgi:hypothetical protein
MNNLPLVGLKSPVGATIKASEGAKNFTRLVPRHLRSFSCSLGLFTDNIALINRGVQVPEELLLQGLEAVTDKKRVLFVREGVDRPNFLDPPVTVAELARMLDEHHPHVEAWLNVVKAEGSEKKFNGKLGLFFHLPGPEGEEGLDGLVVAIPLNLNAIVE